MAKGNRSKKGRSGKKYKKPNRNIKQQVNSKLMQLPQEIRDEIYANIFCSTRLAFGKRAYNLEVGHRIQSAGRGKALAVLRTCRRMRDEVGTSWLKQVLFHFEDPHRLLKKFSGIPTALLKQIRHVRVLGDVIELTPSEEYYYCTARILRLLPGLELDRLTVLGARDPVLSYETLNMLVRYSDGWKELYYLAHNSKLLGHKYNMDPWGPDESSDSSDFSDSDDSDPLLNLRLRQPQPSD
jgi:hypothetical protein